MKGGAVVAEFKVSSLRLGSSREKDDGSIGMFGQKNQPGG